MHDTTARVARQTAEDHQRRAAQAEHEGVRILVDYRTSQHVALSASDATRCYHVDTGGCSCRGFMFRGRSKHHSLLLAELGRIEDAAPSLVAGLGDADVVALYGEPLIDVHTGEVLEPAAWRTATLQTHLGRESIPTLSPCERLAIARTYGQNRRNLAR